ncbi:MAG TPA: siroheme synthase CysG [Beijerinckiaceae bacterium]|nr:siroheme synthase CysG [Beijerinckiaceae bacterium]
MPQSDRTPHDSRPLAIGPLATLPVFFNLEGKRVVVAGGTPAASWKAELLAATGARVHVYAAEPCDSLQQLAKKSELVTVAGRLWRDADLESAAIAVADVDDRQEAARFAAAAKRAGTPVNVVDRPEFCDFQFGAIVERSPLVIGVSTNGAAPVLAQEIRARIEALLPQALRAWAAAAAEWRPHIQARELKFRARRRFWELFATRALADRRQTPVPADLETLLNQAESALPQDGLGSVMLVGAGPGDPDLLTLKAVRALQSADVVLFDDLVSPQTVAMSRRESQKITVGKRGYKPSCTQEDITAMLVDFARQGKRVVRLKGGDPSVFGRANEEMDGLAAAGISFEVVPGVTAASAAAAAIRRSLTERDIARRLQFVTAHARNGQLPDDLDWRSLVDPCATTAVYMGLRTLPALVSRLLAEGLSPDTPAALVENASGNKERCVRCAIGDLPARALAAHMTGPCLVLIGRALEQRDRPPKPGAV